MIDKRSSMTMTCSTGAAAGATSVSINVETRFVAGICVSLTGR